MNLHKTKKPTAMVGFFVVHKEGKYDMKRKLEDSLRCLALRAKFKDPARSIAMRISGINDCSESEFIRRADVILRAIGIIDPEAKKSHYKQFSEEDLDFCPPEAIPALALRMLNSHSEKILGVCIEQLASDLATIDKRQN